MIQTSAPFQFETDKRSYPNWAEKKPRAGLDIAGLMPGAIIRVRPFVLVNLALLVCALSGAVLFTVATLALGATN